MSRPVLHFDSPALGCGHPHLEGQANLGPTVKLSYIWIGEKGDMEGCGCLGTIEASEILRLADIIRRRARAGKGAERG